MGGFCPFIFSSFARRKDTTLKDEKKKRRHAQRGENAMQKDEITSCEKAKDKISARKDEKKNAMPNNYFVVWRGVFSSPPLFAGHYFFFSQGVFFSSFHAAFLVFSHGVFCGVSFVSSHGIFASFRVESFRLFVVKRCLAKRRNDAMR